MIVDPAIAALRSEPASQRRLRAKMDQAHAQWRERHDVALLLADIAKYQAGEAIEQLPALSQLMSSLRKARSMVEDWLAAFTPVLHEYPLAQLPMRHHHADGFTSMQLASAGGVALSLSVYAERETYSAATSAVFCDRDMHDLVLFGEAKAVFFELKQRGVGAQIERSELTLGAGPMLTSIGTDQSRQYERVKGRLVVLQLSRVPETPALTREYAISSGQLLLQSSGDKRASQQEMAMAVLSALHRKDAAPILAAMTQEGPDHMRWEALRHTLALDAGEGMVALERVTRSSSDPLHRPAKQLMQQLRISYPQLAEMEAA